MTFPFKEGDIVQSELFAKLYYEVNDCKSRASFWENKERFNNVDRGTSKPWIDKGRLSFKNKKTAKYTESIYFNKHTTITFFHKENDEYPHENPNRLAVDLSYSLKPPKPEKKSGVSASYDTNGAGLSFVTEVSFDNKAFDEKRGDAWFSIKSVKQHYDDDCDVYTDNWTMILESVNAFNPPIKQHSWEDGIEQEIEREIIVLYFSGRNHKGKGFDRKKINIVRSPDTKKGGRFVQENSGDIN